jgi:nitrogen fixation protein FixH
MAATVQRKSGWWYPWIFVGGFAVVIVVNGILFYNATTTFSGLSTENPYEKGLAYNKTLEEARAQDKLGWKVSSQIDTLEEKPDGGRRVRVAVEFKDSQNLPLEGMQVRAMLIRPAAEGHDKQIALANQGNGLYASEANLDLQGLWEVRIVALGQKNSYQTAERVQIR